MPPTPTLADSIEEIRPSVVNIRLELSDGTLSAGTGFFVNRDGIVVTARHVVNVPARKTARSLKVLTRIPSQMVGTNLVASAFVGTEGNVIATDDLHDIAILSLRRNPFPDGLPGLTDHGVRVTAKPKEVTFEKRLLRDGEAVFTSGFPLSLPNVITTSGA